MLVKKFLNRETNHTQSLIYFCTLGIHEPEFQTPFVVGHVLRTVRAARLLGSQVVLVGVSPKGAREVVRLGTESSDLVAMRSLEEGLAYGMAQRAAGPTRRR